MVSRMVHLDSVPVSYYTTLCLPSILFPSLLPAYLTGPRLTYLTIYLSVRCLPIYLLPVTITHERSNLLLSSTPPPGVRITYRPFNQGRDVLNT